jgi:hypothetical protein
VSTAALSKSASGGGGYEVSRPGGKCALCGQAIDPDQKLMVTLQETPAGFARLDYCLSCWPKHEQKDVVAFWQTVMPRPEAKKKVFVDDTVLCELFERLSDVAEPAKVNFRFVLGLILMRKRLVIYEETRREGERELWRVRIKGKQEMLDLLNPRLGEEQVKEVSQQLGEILNQEL